MYVYDDGKIIYITAGLVFIALMVVPTAYLLYHSAAAQPPIAQHVAAPVAAAPVTPVADRTTADVAAPRRPDRPTPDPSAPPASPAGDAKQDPVKPAG